MASPFLGVSAATALKSGGGIGFPSLDAGGNVKISGATTPAKTPAAVSASLNLDAAGNLRTTQGVGYATVAASQTAQALGTGAVGDVLNGVLIVPATTSPGVVQIKDGAGTAITVFTGGATSVADLKPYFLPLNLTSKTGGWQITTGAAVSVVASGTFTA